MAGGDAFFEEGIHWLHVAGSLGPRIASIHGFRPEPSREGPDRRVKSMLVVVHLDNGAVGSLYYSREVPSLFRGLRLSKLMGRRGIISFESNGVVVLARGKGLPRVILPGFKDIRGYRAMYADFAASIRAGSSAGDEPRTRPGRPATHGAGVRDDWRPPLRFRSRRGICMVKLRTVLVVVMTVALTSVALAQKKPDFSGRWELESAASLVPTKTSEALVPERTSRTITHTVQLLSVQSEVKGGKPVTIEHHLDGRESEHRVENGTCKLAAKWDADKLVIATHFLGNDRIKGLRTIYKRVK